MGLSKSASWGYSLGLWRVSSKWGFPLFQRWIYDPGMCYPWFWSSWWCIDDGVLRLFIRTFSWEKVIFISSRKLIFEDCSQADSIFAFENAWFLQVALSQGARSSHCVELLGCELFLKQGKRWILDTSRRMRWHSSGYLSTSFPDILGSFLSK